MKVVPFDLE